MADLTGMYLFLIFGLATPGPNVILITTSAARFGFYRTVPHILGVVLGVGIIGAATGFGLGILINGNANLQLIMKVISAAWIAYLSWVLWRSTLAKTNASEQPFTFFQAVFFQWVNPKIWVVTIAAMGFLVGLSPMSAALNLGIAIACLNFGVCVVWGSIGQALKTWLMKDAVFSIFVRIMSVLLLVSAAFLFL